jgi:hypothetical protein
MKLNFRNTDTRFKICGRRMPPEGVRNWARARPEKTYRRHCAKTISSTWNVRPLRISGLDVPSLWTISEPLNGHFRMDTRRT